MRSRCAAGNDPDNRHDFPSRVHLVDEGRTAEQAEVWEHVRALVSLAPVSASVARKAETQNLCVTKQQWVYSRTLGNQIAYVEINIADTRR